MARSRARELEVLFDALEPGDLLPNPEDMHALAVLMRAWRRCSRLWDETCPAQPIAADPAWRRDFSHEMQVAFAMGRAYEMSATDRMSLSCRWANKDRWRGSEAAKRLHAD